jgi:hypothetical protein
LHLIGDVRHRVDRETIQGDGADNGGYGGQKQDEPALVNRPFTTGAIIGSILRRFALAVEFILERGSC